MSSRNTSQMPKQCVRVYVKVSPPSFIIHLSWLMCWKKTQKKTKWLTEEGGKIQRGSLEFRTEWQDISMFNELQHLQKSSWGLSSIPVKTNSSCLVIFLYLWETVFRFFFCFVLFSSPLQLLIPAFTTFSSLLVSSQLTLENHFMFSHCDDWQQTVNATHFSLNCRLCCVNSMCTYTHTSELDQENWTKLCGPISDILLHTWLWYNHYFPENTWHRHVLYDEGKASVGVWCSGQCSPTYLSIVAEPLHAFLEIIHGWDLFQLDNVPSHKAKIVQERFEKKHNTKSLRLKASVTRCLSKPSEVWWNPYLLLLCMKKRGKRYWAIGHYATPRIFEWVIIPMEAGRQC